MKTPEARRLSRGILLPSLINKCGSIGMGLIPLILVEQKAPPSASAAIMACIKGAAVFGVLFSGWVADRASPRKAMVLSFLFSGIGMLGLPVAPGLLALTCCAILSNFGQGMFPGSIQLLVKRSIPAAVRQESIGWIRTANNLGSVASYLLGLLFSTSGSAGLFLLDGVTSMIAALIARKSLPVEHTPQDAPPPEPSSSGPRDSTSSASFWWVAGLIACFFFLYELFMTSSAARAGIEFGRSGVKIFSSIMLINTTLCALLGLVAVRIFKNPKVALPLGYALMLIGLGVLSLGRNGFYLGTLIATLGEVIFTSLSAYTLMSLLPAGPHAGKVYSFATLLQLLGKMMGASLSFWWIKGPHPLGLLVGAGVLGSLLFYAYALSQKKKTREGVPSLGIRPLSPHLQYRKATLLNQA